MAAFLIITYDVTDPERFAEYNPGSLGTIGATISKHGGEVVFASAPEMVTGDQRHVAVGLTFPDADAAKAWLEDPEYAEAKAIRLESTDRITSFVVESLGS